MALESTSQAVIEAPESQALAARLRFAAVFIAATLILAGTLAVVGGQFVVGLLAGGVLLGWTQLVGL